MRAPAKLTTLATAAALTGFAANSLLCRAALGADAIDPWSFTLVRLGGGALALQVLVARGPAPRERAGSFTSAVALFAYALAFSLAYVRLDAGVGALVLFAAVQLSMIGWGIRAGERPGAVEWLGLGLALGGIAVLAARGLGASRAPDGRGLAAMAAAGVAWGVYSLRGRGSSRPLATTAGNFLRAVPLALLALVPGLFHGLRLGARGVGLALASGVVASGLGYAVWYRALRGLSATRAAVLQLLVPVLAAAGGILLLGERATPRLLLAGAMILGGVGLAVRGRRS